MVWAQGIDEKREERSGDRRLVSVGTYPAVSIFLFLFPVSFSFLFLNKKKGHREDRNRNTPLSPLSRPIIKERAEIGSEADVFLVSFSFLVSGPMNIGTRPDY